MKKQNCLRTIKKELPYHLMLLVPVIFTIIYKYIPMAGIIIAFEDYTPGLGFFKSPWVGLSNFTTLFTISGFPQVIRNTVVIALGKIILGIIVPVIFSLLLNEMHVMRIKKAIQTIIYMPHFISWVLMAGIFSELLGSDGIVNRMLSSLGSKEPIIFLANSNIFPYILVGTNVWKEFGYGTIIYLAALSGLNPDLYEAASIDGAGRWKQTLHITLPGIAPTIVLMTILGLSEVLNAGFDQVFNMYSPVVYSTGDIIDTFIYRMGFKSIQLSISTAASLFKSAISCMLIIISYRIAEKATGYKVF